MFIIVTVSFVGTVVKNKLTIWPSVLKNAPNPQCIRGGLGKRRNPANLKVIYSLTLYLICIVTICSCHCHQIRGTCIVLDKGFIVTGGQG